MYQRAIALGSLFLLLFVASAGAEDRDEKELKKMGDSDQALQLKVNMAVQNGMKHLLSIQEKDGSWKGTWAKYAAPHDYPMGETALCALALLKSGVHRSDEQIERAFKFLRAQPLKKTYEVSVLLMALEARYAPNKPAPVDKREITQVVRKKVKMPRQDLEWMEECVRFLISIRVSSQRLFGEDTGSAQAYKDIWHYPMTTGDHSNTQFALLGLKSAAKCGINIPDEIWVNTIKHFVEVQEKEGPEVRRWQIIEDKKHGYVSYKPMTAVPDHARGWAYGGTVYPKAGSSDDRYATTGSMTCVGVSSVAIALGELDRKCPKGLRDKGEESIRDGLAWLDHNWKIDENPQHPEKRWLYYYLYGLERVGVLTWTRAFGKHDWYREGAEYLIANQKGDGSWQDPVCYGPINSTCFALLFLTRATVPGKPVLSGGRHR